MPKKRQMTKFIIDEISSVDRPAQTPAVSVIMKRKIMKRNVEKAGDMVDILTSVADGHQHGLGIEQYDEELYIYVHYAGESNNDTHDHKIIIGESGQMIVSENFGHTHEIDSDTLRNLIFNRLTNKREGELVLPEIKGIADLSKAIQDFDKADDKSAFVLHVQKCATELGMADLIPKEGEFASILKKAANSGGGPQVGDNTMPLSKEAAAEKAAIEKKAADEKAALEAKLAKSESIGTLTDVQKAYYKAMEESEQDAFLAKSAEERQKEIDLLKADDPVVYKSTAGEEFHKSDDTRLVAMAKRNDVQDVQLAKAAKREEDSVFTKRAATELEFLPGTIEVRAAILKAVDTIEDEAIRKSATESLAAKNTEMSKAFQQAGSSIVVNKADSAEAHAELDRLAKKHQADNPGVDFYTAYEVVTKANTELYNKAVAG